MATSRQFNGTSSDFITLNVGSVGAFGSSTICAVVYRDNLTNTCDIFSAGSSDNWDFSVSNTGPLGFYNGTSFELGVTTIAASKWYFVAATKATGSNKVRFHIYDYAAATWVHEDTGGAAQANSGAPSTRLRIGNNAATATTGWPGRIHCVGYWGSTNMTDAQVESLKDSTLVQKYGGAANVKPTGFWPLNQPGTGTGVVDQSGNGSGQSALGGTSILPGNPDFDQPPVFFPVTVKRQSPLPFPLGLGEIPPTFWVNTGQTIEIGIATETDTALPITRQKTKEIGLATETDTALSITPIKASSLVPVGLITETNTAQAMTRAKVKTLGLTTETDTALSIARTKTKTIGLATETDTAQSISRAKTKAIGLTTETDSALSITRTKIKAIGLTTETDTALSIARKKTIALGLATETDIANPITVVQAGGGGGGTAHDLALLHVGS